VHFTRRPIGSLATAFPAPLGDGTSASVGEVAAAFGAVADDGVRRDLRWVTSVTRPATSDRGREVLDVADPLPVGRPLLPRERADELTAAYRAATRRSSPQLSYSLTGVAGSAGADGWYVGCVPELCLTVWAGPTPAPAAGPVQPGTAVTPDPASLAARVVTDTLARYAAVAPDRVTLPFLPVARATTPSTSAPDRASAPTTATTPRPRPEVSGPPARATPAPRATSASPAPVAATPSPTPTPTGTTKANDPVDGGGTGGGGDPVAQGPALRTTPGSST
jgi:membrane peptidoglycan carboxypeptidase